MTGALRIGIVGGGAWGAALGLAAVRAGSTATLWARNPATVAAIRDRHEHAASLPGIALDPALHATGDLSEAARADAVMLVVPAQAVRQMATALGAHLAPGVPVIVCAKGIERGTGALMSEVMAECLPANPVGILSGPTFAIEVARGLPTAVTLAIGDRDLGERLAVALGSAAFRPYWTDDVIGAEVGGAVKNVLAIACGIVAGRGLGDNARAALMTRGLAEITRLALALGGRSETLMGLAGFGDLALTCTSTQSRNLSLGLAIGRGEVAAGPDGRTSGPVIEGRHTAPAVLERAARLGVEMPISAAVDAVVNHGADIMRTMTALMTRPLRAEG